MMHRTTCIAWLQHGGESNLTTKKGDHALADLKAKSAPRAKRSDDARGLQTQDVAATWRWVVRCEQSAR